MTSERSRTAVLTVVVGVLGTAVLTAVLGRSNLGVGIAVGVVMLACLGALLLATFRTGRHVPWAEAQRRVEPGHAVVLWKPTCGYCERLLRSIGQDPRVTWVNVWIDKDANATVREHNDGDELTPTVLIGDAVLRNPSAAEVDRALAPDR